MSSQRPPKICYEVPVAAEVDRCSPRQDDDHESPKIDDVASHDDSTDEENVGETSSSYHRRQHDQHWLLLEFKNKDTEARYMDFRYGPAGLYFPLAIILVMGVMHFSVTQMNLLADMLRDPVGDWMFSSKATFQTPENRDVRLHYTINGIFCFCVAVVSVVLRFTLWREAPSLPAWFLELLWAIGNFTQGATQITEEFRYRLFCRLGYISILQRDPLNEIMTSCDDFYEPYIACAATVAVVLPIRLRYLPLWYIVLLTPIIFNKLYFQYEHTFRNSDALWMPSTILFCTIFLGSIEMIFRRQFIQRDIFEHEVQETKNAQKAVKKLLVAMLPKSVLKRIMANETISDTGVISAVFSDVAGFTAWCSSHKAKTVVAMLNTMYTEFDNGLKRYGIEKVKTIGDAYWAMCGLPDPNEDHALHICAFAKYMLRSVERMRQDNPARYENIHLRLGVATGRVCGGLVGSHQSTYDVFGTTTEIAETMEQNAPVDGILISEETYCQLKNEHNVIPNDDVDNYNEAVTTARVEQKPAPVNTPLGPMATYILHSFNWMPSSSSTSTETTMGKSTTTKESTIDEEASVRRVTLDNLNESGNESTVEGSLNPSTKREGGEPVGPSAVSGEEEESVNELEKELSKASHCLHHTFDNEQVEAEFQTFMALHFSRKFRVVSVLLGMLVFNIFVVMLAEGKSHPWHTYMLLTLLIIAIVAQVGIANNMQIHSLVGLATFYLECNLLLVTLVFANRSVATMDLLYLPFNFTMMSPTLGYIGAKLPYLYMCVLNITFLFVPSLIAQVVSKTMYIHHFVAPGMFMCIWIIALRRSEKGQRQQFLDEKLAEVALTQTRSEHEKVSELLSKMVPRFIVDELTVWFCGPRTTMIAANFRLIGILFARVPSLRLQLSDKSMNPIDVMSAISRYATICDSVLEDFCGCTKLKIIGDILMFGSGLDQHASSDRNVKGFNSANGSTTASSQQVSTSYRGGRLDKQHHHNDGNDSRHSAETYQQMVNEVRSQATNDDGTSSLSTNFQPQQQQLLQSDGGAHLVALAHLALALSEKVESELHGAVLSAGMHCGSASAGIIGTDRLIYDVFGDTVNTASRVMSTSGEGVWASVKFSTTIATTSFKPNLFFGAREDRVMKGKGLMHVVSVTQLPEI